MPRAGVLINPNSGRGNGKGTGLAEKLAGADTITLRVLDDFTRLTPYLFEMAKDGVTDLFISSGDGTIQAILTLIAERPIFKTQPRICLLPHGTTNLTSIDLGSKLRDVSAQVAFITGRNFQKIVTRPTLRISNVADGAVRHGMTMGLGAATHGTRHAQQAFNDKGVHGSIAALRTLGSAVAKTVFTRANPDDHTRLDRASPMTVRNNGATLCEGPQLMLVATTLEKMFFNANPFWGESGGHIRVSVFPHPVPNLARWLWPILYGGKNRKVPKGALSFSTDSFEVETTSSIVLDGEFFEPPVSGALKIETGQQFQFICG